MNPSDGEVGNFQHPEFFETIENSFGGDRTNSDEEEYAGPSIGMLKYKEIKLDARD